MRASLVRDEDGDGEDMADHLLTTTLVAAVDSHLATCSDLRQRAF